MESITSIHLGGREDIVFREDNVAFCRAASFHLQKHHHVASCAVRGTTSIAWSPPAELVQLKEIAYGVLSNT